MAEQNKPYLEDASTRRGKQTRAWAMLQIASWKSLAATRKVRPLEKAGGGEASPADPDECRIQAEEPSSADPWLSNEDCRTQAENSPRLVERGSLETPLPEMIAIERRVRRALY